MIADRRCFISSLLLACDVLLLDQLSKWLVLDVMNPDRRLIEILPWFNLALVWNRGISFGMFASHNQPVLLVVLSLAIVWILLRWLCKNVSWLVSLALGLIIGGAIGNVVDRLRFGAVVDFFDAHIGAYHWPAFNIADSAIFIGIVLLCLNGMFTGHSGDTP